MAIPCFVRSVDDVVNLGNDTFRVTLSCSLMDTANSTFTTEFNAIKGADWRVQARMAVQERALSGYGETVDLIILPSLETI